MAPAQQACALLYHIQRVMMAVAAIHAQCVLSHARQVFLQCCCYVAGNVCVGSTVVARHYYRRPVVSRYDVRLGAALFLRPVGKIRRLVAVLPDLVITSIDFTYSLVRGSAADDDRNSRRVTTLAGASNACSLSSHHHHGIRPEANGMRQLASPHLQDGPAAAIPSMLARCFWLFRAAVAAFTRGWHSQDKTLLYDRTCRSRPTK